MQIANTLIIMRGYPGTGKSTIAQAIASTLHIPLIDRDVIRQVIANILGSHAEVGHIAYEMIFALAREQLQLGLSLVIDTPLTYYRTYEQACQLAASCHVSMLVVHCQCAPEIQKQRLESRKGKVSAFQITSWEEWQRWKPRFEEFDDGGCVIDTTNQIEESLASILQAIHQLHSSSISASKKV